MSQKPNLRKGRETDHDRLAAEAMTELLDSGEVSVDELPSEALDVLAAGSIASRAERQAEAVAGRIRQRRRRTVALAAAASLALVAGIGLLLQRGSAENSSIAGVIADAEAEAGQPVEVLNTHLPDPRGLAESILTLTDPIMPSQSVLDVLAIGLRAPDASLRVIDHDVVRGLLAYGSGDDTILAALISSADDRPALSLGDLGIDAQAAVSRFDTAVLAGPGRSRAILSSGKDGRREFWLAETGSGTCRHLRLGWADSLGRNIETLRFQSLQELTRFVTDDPDTADQLAEVMEAIEALRRSQTSSDD